MTLDFFASLQTGARVVVRYRLDSAATGPAGEAFSDALGYLVEADEGRVIVQTRGGEVSINRSAITHAKSVPPPPVRRRASTQS